MSVRNSALASLLIALGLPLSACVSMHGDASVLAPATVDGRGDSALAAQQVFYLAETISLVQFSPLDAQKAASRQPIKRKRINAGTPGLVVGRGEDWLAVRFEGDDYLYFTRVENTLDGTRVGDQRLAGRYYLYLPDWDGRAGTVLQGGQRWLAVENSRYAYLLGSRNASAEPSLRNTSLCSTWMDEKR